MSIRESVKVEWLGKLCVNANTRAAALKTLAAIDADNLESFDGSTSALYDAVFRDRDLRRLVRDARRAVGLTAWPLYAGRCGCCDGCQELLLCPSTAPKCQNPVQPDMRASNGNQR